MYPTAAAQMKAVEARLVYQADIAIAEGMAKIRAIKEEVRATVALATATAMSEVARIKASTSSSYTSSSHASTSSSTRGGGSKKRQGEAKGEAKGETKGAAKGATSFLKLVKKLYRVVSL